MLINYLCNFDKFNTMRPQRDAYSRIPFQHYELFITITKLLISWSSSGLVFVTLAWSGADLSCTDGGDDAQADRWNFVRDQPRTQDLPRVIHSSMTCKSGLGPKEDDDGGAAGVDGAVPCTQVYSFSASVELCRFTATLEIGKGENSWDDEIATTSGHVTV